MSGVGVECYKYVGNDFVAQQLEIEEMIAMDWPRLNYWAAVCVRSMNYVIGAQSETDWFAMLDKVEEKTKHLRHESDQYSVVDGRYKARTRGSPPTFTHIYKDIHSFKDDLQPISPTVLFGNGDIVLSFSWIFLQHDLAEHFLPFLHEFGRNSLMLNEYLELASWNVMYGEEFVGEYIQNGIQIL